MPCLKFSSLDVEYPFNLYQNIFQRKLFILLNKAKKNFIFSGLLHGRKYSFTSNSWIWSKCIDVQRPSFFRVFFFYISFLFILIAKFFSAFHNKQFVIQKYNPLYNIAIILGETKGLLLGSYNKRLLDG